MSGSFGQLDQVLGQQLAGLTALKNWLPRKVELLGSNRLEDLEALIVREEAQMQKLHALDGERRVLMGILARELGLPATPSLADLVHRAPATDRVRLQARLEALEATASEWRRLRSVAAPRLDRALDHVHLTLDALAELSSRPAPEYDAAPSTRPGHVTLMVDRTA